MEDSLVKANMISEMGMPTISHIKIYFFNIEVDKQMLSMVKVCQSDKENQCGDVLFTGSSEIVEEVGMSSAVTDEVTELVYLNSFSFGVRFNDNIVMTPEFAKHFFVRMK